MRSSRLVVAGLLAASLIGIVPRDVEAIPAFARKYRVSCSLCHSTIPRLTAFGEEFASHVGRSCPLPRELPFHKLVDWDATTGQL